jgi:hypothetical protein
MSILNELEDYTEYDEYEYELDKILDDEIIVNQSNDDGDMVSITVPYESEHIPAEKQTMTDPGFEVNFDREVYDNYEGLEDWLYSDDMIGAMGDWLDGDREDAITDIELSKRGL